MPFTFAHPVTVLYFPRNSRYFHFPALVLGTMSPDFMYMLHWKTDVGGHTLFGSEWVNLPLCLLFYAVYRLILATPIKQHLPAFCGSNVPQATFKNPLAWLIVFLYSAWIGMATHIALDELTHDGGYFVQLFPILQTKIIFHIYDWLQYGIGAVGLISIILYQRRMAGKYPYRSSRSAKQKWFFWLSVVSLTVIIFYLSNPLYPLVWNEIASIVLRIINSFFISLTIHGLIFTVMKKRSLKIR
ncbi:DUF4184 family protein [Basfia succiniciproducens]|uniref:DUF4184 domain-containing protein n=1 Tax=Basfia succiniciproducens TaxID=653940 RepID=A0A1G5DL30_9PAST|nr:DUF4184 family protein [Basfia succiniciproducens]QIM69477.1 hypothetical protein A4G13_08780 [Basfia succiniciproducens]SCY15221.1 protein of unknown function [Basfia succiniciproducens]